MSDRVVDSINDAKALKQRAIDTGDSEDRYLNSKTGYYNNLEDSYRGQADTAYGDLANTPGYTADQAAQIKGNPKAGFDYYNPNSISDDVNASALGVNGALGDYRTNLGDSATHAGSDVTGAASKLGADLTGAAGKYGTDLGGAAAGAKGDLNRPADDQLNWQGGVYNYEKGANDANYGNLDKGLDQAVDPNKLALSDKFAGDYALSDEQGQNIKDVAANTVKGQYQREQDQLAQQAFAQGNSSPAQIAALQMQLGRQGARDAGDAASAAELGVNKEAAARQQTLEGMRLGTQQDISSRLTANAGTRYGAATGAANTLSANELAGINAATATRQTGASQAATLGYDAARTGGAAQVAAAQTAGQAGVDAAKVAGDYNVNAADKVGQAAIDAGKYTGSQRLASDTGQQQVGQGLAVGADAAGSQRATTVANADIAGQDKVRGFYTGEQGTAQQGTQTATGQQIQSQGTQGALANSAAATEAGTATQEKSIDKQPGSFERIGTSLIGAAGGAAGGGSFGHLAIGGIADHPTSVVLGEAGPEMVMPLGGPRRRYRMAA